MEKIIASSFSQQIRKIKKQPGAYRWWFPEKEAKDLLKLVHFKNEMLKGNRKLQERKIGGETYIAMYYGISNNMRRRIRNHLFGSFGDSTLRETLGSIIATNIAIDDAKLLVAKVDDLVDELIDKCYWEYEYVESGKEAEKKEKEALAQNEIAYPLNIKVNNTVIPKWKGYLKALRKDFNEKIKLTKTK